MFVRLTGLWPVCPSGTFLSTSSHCPFCLDRERRHGEPAASPTPPFVSVYAQELGTKTSPLSGRGAKVSVVGSQVCREMIYANK